MEKELGPLIIIKIFRNQESASIVYRSQNEQKLGNSITPI